jgi:hypothetical protein
VDLVAVVITAIMAVGFVSSGVRGVTLAVMPFESIPAAKTTRRRG